MYFKNISINFKSLLQYRVNTLFFVLNNILVTLFDFLSLEIVLGAFNSLGGYEKYNFYITFGIVMICFSLVECFARGIDHFPKFIKTGELDKFLSRPRSILKQTLSYEQDFTKLGRAAVGVVVLVSGLANSSIEWTVLKGFCLAFTIISGIVIVFSLFLVSAGISVFTVGESEVLNILTNGGRDLLQYPIDLYGDNIFRKFFTYIIPFACFNFFPLHYIIDMNDSIWGGFLTPIYGMIIIIPAYLFFRFALKRYKSAGS